MSESLGQLIVELTADNASLKANLRRAEDYIKGYEKTSKTSLTKASKEWNNHASNMKGVVTGIKVAVAAAFAVTAYKTLQLAKESALLAARFETLGIVMKQVGGNAGYTAKEMDAYDNALRKTGISMIESRSNLTKMAQAQLDLTKATQLGRIAQDAAVIGNINSSEAFARMIYGIQSGNLLVLETIGINVNFENSYKKVAKELGRTTTSFSESEKAIIRQNAVLDYGGRIAGTYEAAMGTAGKKLTSFTRYVEDFKVKMGAAFGPSMVILIDSATEAMKQLQIEISKPETQASLQRIAIGISSIITVLSNDVPGKFKKVETALIFITDAVSGVGRVFTILGSLVALQALHMEKSMLQFADIIVNKPTQALNKLVEAYNAIPVLEPIEFKFVTLGVGQDIANELDSVSGAIEEAKKDINTLFDTDLAGTKFQKSIQIQQQELAKMASALKSDKIRFGSGDPDDVRAKAAKAALLAQKEAEIAERTAEIKKKTLEEYAKFYDEIMLSTYEQDKKALDAEYIKFKAILGDKIGLQIAYNTALAKLQKERDEGVVSKVDTSLNDYFSGIDAKINAERELYNERKSIQDQFSADQRSLFMTDTEQEIYNLQGRFEYYKKGVQDKVALEKWFAESLKQINDKSIGENLSLSQSVSKGIDMALKDIQDKTLTTAQMISSSIGTAVNGVTTAMGQWLDGTKSFKEAFSDMARQVLKDLANMIMKQLLYNAISSIAGMGAKDGASFGGGSSTEFAKGGTFTNSIVSKPTMFKYGKGDNFGVMGEAGPEAIMPLSRGAGGELGVKVANGGQTQAPPPQVNVKNINVYDPAVVGDYLAMDEGEQLVVNIMQRNKSVMED